LERIVGGNISKVRDVGPVGDLRYTIPSPAGRAPWSPSYAVGIRLRHVVQGAGAKGLAIIGPQHTVCGLAEAVGLLQYRVEHRREVAG
jgi:hypothetical protein